LGERDRGNEQFCFLPAPSGMGVVSYIPFSNKLVGSLMWGIELCMPLKWGLAPLVKDT